MKKQNNKIILSVDDRSFATWKSVMGSLSEDWRRVWYSWNALSIGEINKEILCSLIDNVGNKNIRPRVEEYITDCLKEMYLQNGVATLLHPQLINSDRVKIDGAITAISKFKNKIYEIKGSGSGHRIQDWKVLEIENLPIDGNKINISESFLQEAKERLFTRFLKEGEETALYLELTNLCNRLNEVKKLFKRRTRCPDLFEVIEQPYFHYDQEEFKPNHETLIWYFSNIPESEAEV